MNCYTPLIITDGFLTHLMCVETQTTVVFNCFIKLMKNHWDRKLYRVHFLDWLISWLGQVYLYSGYCIELRRLLYLLNFVTISLISTEIVFLIWESTVKMLSWCDTSHKLYHLQFFDSWKVNTKDINIFFMLY